MFNKSILNEIRDRISIAAFIGERIPLKRAGKNLKGLCPFHNEKTPSFNVSDDKGIYHCFGCGEGGDIFEFTMKFDSVNFAEAVKYLAGRAGVELPRFDDPKERALEDEIAKKKRWCFRINEIARDYFVSRLFDEKVGVAARAYLQHREIQREFSTQLFLGFADNNWEALSFHLKEKGVPLELCCELGLLKKRDGGGYYDFFRNRLIFPIMSPRGEVLGFSGRDLSGSDEGAKYLNSPDSVIYHKSNCVYGLDKAQNAIRSENAVILVEGNIDLVALHQAGIANVVAPLGTALTAGHLRLLLRYTRNMVVVFDGDQAGNRAALRSLEIFIGEGLSPRVVPLPAGEDPDTLIKKEGPDKFRLRISNAPSLFEYFVDSAAKESGSDAAGKIAAMNKVIPLIKMVSDPAERGIYRRYLSRRLDVDEQSIERVLGTQKTNAVLGKAKPNGELAELSVERLLIEIMLTRPNLAAKVLAEIGVEIFEDGWCRTIAELLNEHLKDGKNLRIGEFIEGLADTELAGQIRQISFAPEKCSDDELEELVRDCVAKIKERPILLRIEEINNDIKRAEMEGQEETLLALLTEKRNLRTPRRS